jgi:hypothetical protein
MTKTKKDICLKCLKESGVLIFASKKYTPSIFLKKDFSKHCTKYIKTIKAQSFCEYSIANNFITKYECPYKIEILLS